MIYNVSKLYSHDMKVYDIWKKVWKNDIKWRDMIWKDKKKEIDIWKDRNDEYIDYERKMRKMKKW